MWLDRFSGHSTPATSATPNRGFSPAPRRSTQLTPGPLSRRPGLTPRTSSLSAASFGTSTDSLPPAARVPNGSNLKNELATGPTGDVPDPLDVLQSILGIGAESERDSQEHDGATKPDPLFSDINFEGLSLDEFANKELSDEAAAVSSPVVEDFEKEKDRFQELHTTILACDEVLKSVESYLSSFQTELAAVSSEIEHLQNRSATLNGKLQNRKALEKLLGPEVDTLVIPPAVVKKLTEGAIDEGWIRALDELERRSKAIESKSKDDKDIRAIQDVRPFIDEISDKAVERIRDYVVAQVKALRSPSINAQLIQRNSFLRYKDVFGFLARRQPELASDITQAYNNTMHWYYSSHFARYKTALDKLNLYQVDQTEDMTADAAAKRVPRPGATPDPFSIGRRGESLHIINDTAIPSFAAEEDKSTHHLEVPFRAFNLALVDNACEEYSFLTTFFTKQPYQTTNRQFITIFTSTFELGLAFTKSLIDHSLDAFGLLLCVRITQRLAFELQRRKVPSVESYINGTNMLLWPRFQQIIDHHCDSLRKATASLPGKPAGSALSLTSGSSSTAQTTAPHFVTQRFANFMQGILSLSSEAGDDEPVSHSLGRLRTEFESFLIKLSKGIAEARKRERFLYNNYSLIVTIMGDTEGRRAEELRGHFGGLKDGLKVEGIS